MNGRTRIALHATSATLLTSICLWPLVTPADWLVEAALLLLVVTLAGLGLRRLGAPRALVPLFQLLLLLLLLTVAFASSQAILGVLPGPGAFTRLSDLVNQGTQDMSEYSAPAPAQSGLTLIMVGSVCLIGLLVDALAVTFQRVALTGLPLLALYAVGAGLHSSGPLWLWFLLSAGGYLSLLMAEGRDRLSRWGRVFHGNPSTLLGDPGGNPLNATGYRIAGVALAFGLLLPVALPSLGDGLLGRIGGNGSGLGGNSIATAVNPLASIGESLNESSDQTVLTYTSTSDARSDQYLRIVDLDQFNGVAWTTSKHEVEKLPSPLPTPDGLGSGVPQGAMSDTISTVSNYVQQWLPMPYPATGVHVSGDWEYEPEGRTLIGGSSGTTAAGLKYTVTSLLLQPTAQELQDAPAPSAAMLKTYTQLPSDLPAVVRSDALSVTRGATTAYDKALDLQNWFTISGGFTYNTSVPGDTSVDAMAKFLASKQGFCVHFAATMAAMARSLGIPARVDIGFAPGTEEPDGTWVVSTKDAHAWPELYFAGVGWLRFEPTPSVGVAPAYTVNNSSNPVSTPATGPTSKATAPVSKPVGGSACQAQTQGHRVSGAGCGGDDTGGATASATGASGLNPWELGLIAAGGLLLLLLLFPMFWRQWTRRARLRPSPASAAGSASGSGTLELSERQVLAAWDEMIDSAWDLGIPPDAGETPRHTAARLVELGELGEEQRHAVGRVALATEQVLYAPSADTPASLRQDVRAVRSGLRASADRRTRVRALLLPPSGARLYARVRASARAGVERTVRRPVRAARGRTASGLRRLVRPLRRGDRED